MAEASLQWNANTEPDLAGYRVYWSLTTGGPYDQGPGGLGKDVGNTTVDTVTGLNNDTDYFFVVTAYDTSNNESGFSNEVSANIASPAQIDVIAHAVQMTSAQVIKHGSY